MLISIEGTSLPYPPWSTFAFERVLQYYDGPRLLLQRNQAGQLFLAWWSDADEDVERWVYLPLSEPRLHAILSGVIPSYEALHTPEDGYLLVIDKDMEDMVVQTVMTDVESIPSDALPLPDARLSIPIPEEISKIPSRSRAHLLDVRIESVPSDPTGRVGARIIGQFIGNLQRLIDALGQAKAGQPTPRGNIPSNIQAKTRLDLVGGYVGSFGIHFETHEEDDLLGSSLVRDSLTSLFDLFDVGYQASELTSQLQVLRTRVAKNYSDLLSTIESSIHLASLNWNQPGTMLPRQALIYQEEARNILAQIEAATDTIQDNITFEGRFIGGSVRTLRFEVRTLDSDERFDGSIHEDAVEQVERITLGSSCRVTLQPHLQVSEATGEERTVYTLLEIEPL